MSERFSRLTFGFSLALGALGAGAASAQDYTAGKTPAQLFQSDCTACHKSPQGLAKGQDARSIAAFLREHYTTKDESAVALAGYLAGSAGAGQRLGAAGPKPKPERPGAPGTAEGEAAPKPTARSRTASTPAAANGEEKAGEGDAVKPAPRNATRATEPRAGTRRAAAPPVTEPEAEGAHEPVAGETPIMREEPPKPQRTRAGHRVDPAADKLKFYASSGGSLREIERSADPTKKLESYATSGTPASAGTEATPKDGAPGEAGGAEAASPPAAEAASPPANEAKPKKKRNAAATAGVVGPAPASTPPSTPRRAQHRPQPPIQPPPGNN